MSHLIDISLLKRNRDYSKLYAGQFMSLIGTMISMVALPYQVYHLTQSTLMVGLLSLAQLVPLLLTAMMGGVLADRYDRWSLVVISECLLTVGCGLLALNAYMDHPSVWVVFMIASLMSAVTGTHRPAFESMIQQIVEPKDYRNVGVLRGFQYGFGMTVGPALSGLILAYFGLTFAYLIDLSTFAISLFVLQFIRHIPKPIVTKHASALASLKEGVRFAFSREELFGSYSVDFIAMIFAMPNALFPAMAQSFGGVKTLGLLYSAPALGSMLISLFSGWTAKVKHDGRAIAIAASLWGLSMIGFGLSSSLILALFFLTLSGAFDMISGIFRSALWNHIIPHEFRGRLAGIEMLSYLSGPKLGDTRAGILASYIGITSAIVSGGVLCLIGVTAVCFYCPKFWAYQPLNESVE